MASGFMTAVCTASKRMREIFDGNTWLGICLMALTQSVCADWLPGVLRDGLVGQLARNLAQTELNRRDDPRGLMKMSASLVSMMESRVAELGAERIVSGAPQLPGIELPEIADTRVRSMAIYGLCGLYVDKVFSDPGLSQGRPKMKVNAAVFQVGTVMIADFLRRDYLASGGSERELVDLLGQKELARLSGEIASDRDMLLYTWRECSPRLAALLNG